MRRGQAAWAYCSSPPSAGHQEKGEKKTRTEVRVDSHDDIEEDDEDGDQLNHATLPTSSAVASSLRPLALAKV